MPEYRVTVPTRSYGSIGIFADKTFITVVAADKHDARARAISACTDLHREPHVMCDWRIEEISP